MTELSDQLKHFSRNSKVAEAVFKSFVTRLRTRNQVYARALRRRVAKEQGQNYPLEAYCEVLAGLGRMGLGDVVKNTRGRVVALRNVVTTLQSIGEVALAGSDRVRLVKWGKSRALESVPKLVESNVVLTFVMHGLPINVSLPRGLVSEDLTQIVTKLNELAV